MTNRADGRKISDFLGTDTLSDSDVLTLVRSSTNYKITVANLKTQLGVGTSSSRGLIYMQGNSTATTISASDTPVLIAGTWSSEAAAGFTASAAGRLTYTGSTTQVFKVDAHVSATSATDSPDAAIKIAKNGTTIAATKIGNRMANTHNHNLSTCWELSLVTNDYIELFIENNSDTTNLTVVSAVLRVS